MNPPGIELALTSNNGVFDSVAENSSQHNITVTASFSDIRWPTDAADAALRPADPRDVDTTVRVEFDSANSAAAQTDLERFQVADSQGTFQDVESFDIVIPAGQTSGTTTLRIKPANDDVDEEGETVILQGAEVVACRFRRVPAGKLRLLHHHRRRHPWHNHFTCEAWPPALLSA